MTGAEPTAAPAPPALAPDRDAQLAELEARLDVRFRDRRLLDLALRHGSYAPPVPGEPRQSYERLELLGDAVLSLVVCDHLYHRYPEATEGDLAKLRARIVSEPWLARIAGSLDLGRYILLGKGEEKAGGRSRPALLADVLEAVLGAVYVDSGYGVAHAVATRLLQDAFDALEEPSEDYKSELQEWLQRRERRVPRYRIRGQEGPDHARVFVATVEAGGQILGEGRGPSKKQAEQAAARDALRRLLHREGAPRPAGEPVPAASAGPAAGATAGRRRGRRRRHGRGTR